MFETPAITCLGKVEDVVLGMFSFGWELDGTMSITELEFATDGETDEL